MTKEKGRRSRRGIVAAPFSSHGAHGPFLVFPGWPFLREAWALSALCGLWFALVYGGCNWITAHRAWRVSLGLPFEQGWPLVPAMSVFYLSIYPLFAAGPFIVRTRRGFRALVAALALSTLVAGAGFLLLPAEPFQPPPVVRGFWASAFRFADGVNLDYNLAPSLHVALSVGCILAFRRRAAFPGRLLLWTWAGLVALSTVLLHQHYLFDVVTGWFLAVFADRVARRLFSLPVDEPW